MTKSERDARHLEAVTYLRNVLPAGSTVYTVLSSVSRSGMTRTIKFFATHNNSIRNISHAIADAIDYRMSKNREGVTVSGCGMDMGYHVVSSLARELGIELNHRWL